MKVKLEVLETKNGRWRWVLRDHSRTGANGNPLILAQCRPGMYGSESEARDDFADTAVVLSKMAEPEAEAEAPPETAPAPEPRVGMDPVLAAILGATLATGLIFGLTYLL